MKISTIGLDPGSSSQKVVKKSAGGEFSANLDLARREDAENDLAEMLKKINKLGEELKEKPGPEKIKEYKSRIKEYLSFVLKHYYKLTPNYGRYSAQLLIRVEVINRKIEELTAEFIRQQKGAIDIIGRIDEIAGLLVDLYS